MGSQQVWSLIAVLVSVLASPTRTMAQPLGQDITISPPLGTAMWNGTLGRWQVLLDGPVTTGADQIISVTGVASLAGDLPQLQGVEVACTGNGFHIYLNVSNVYSVSRLFQNLPGSFSHVYLNSCETQYWMGEVGAPDSVDVDKILGMNIGTDLRGGLMAPQGIAGVEVGSNFYGDLDTDGALERLTIGRRLARNSSLEFATFNVGGSIDYMEAGEIHADITVGSSGAGGDGRVSIIKATTGGGTNFGNYSGNFDGSLTAVDLRELGPTGERSLIQVLGDLNADLYFEHEIGDDNDADPAIQVTGDLTGQIVINGVDSTYDWEGAIAVGSSTLGPDETGDEEGPYYGILSAELGGGAIGLVPFMYHAKESAPEHDAVITTGAFTGDVTIEHYGPVADADDDTSTTPPVKVYRLALQVPPPGTVPDPKTTEVCDNRWTDVTSSYTYAVSGRVVTVNGPFANWRAYEIIPNDLVCNIDGTPDVIYDQGWQGTIGCNGVAQTYGYGFQVKTGFDLNQNMAVESGDIETWLIDPADFDGDEDGDVNDLGMLVDAVVNGGE